MAKGPPGGTPIELVRCAIRGYLGDGSHLDVLRGTSTHVSQSYILTVHAGILAEAPCILKARAITLDALE